MTALISGFVIILNLRLTKNGSIIMESNLRKSFPDITLKGQVIEGRSEYFQYPFILRSEIHTIPEWFRNSIVYNIFPDSFATEKEAYGL